jgi:hypothetical protein
MDIKKAQEGTQAAFDGAQCKDTLLSFETGLSIQNWLKENYHNRFSTDGVNKRFDVSLNKEDIWKIYKGNFTVNYPKFSYFKAPVTNTNPAKEIDLLQLFKAITGTHYKQLTETYRAMKTGTDKNNFKKTRFDYVTFAGTFNARKSENLKNLSGYACFDFDHVQNIDVFKNLLAADIKLNAQMVFISPSGDGLKMILFNDDGDPYDEFYSDVTNYLKSNYPSFGGSLDAKTKDTARACFVCHDANCYIKPQYLELWQAEKN